MNHINDQNRIHHVTINFIHYKNGFKMDEIGTTLFFRLPVNPTSKNFFNQDVNADVLLTSITGTYVYYISLN